MGRTYNSPSLSKPTDALTSYTSSMSSDVMTSLGFPMPTISPFFMMMQVSQYLAIREMSCSATRTVMSFFTMAFRYSMTSSLYFMSRWEVGSSTSISLGCWT